MDIEPGQSSSFSLSYVVIHTFLNGPYREPLEGRMELEIQMTVQVMTITTILIQNDPY